MNVFLKHYGILGMKWGVRRYQNADGSLTAAGKERYGSGTHPAKASWRSRRLEKRVKKYESEAQSFDSYPNGIADKKGRVLVSPEEVRATKDRYEQLAEDARHDLELSIARDNRIQLKKDRSLLSNEMLENAIHRLEREQRLRTLTDSEVSAGEAFANSVLQDVGKKVAITALSGAALYGLGSVFTRNFNFVEFGRAIFAGGAKKK